MTYLQFHGVFILPPLLLLAAMRPWRRLGRRAGLFLPLVAAIALVYTTLWDNYLVSAGIWWYGPDRVIGTVGWVPVEEYLFFLLQPLLAGLWFFHLLGREAPPTFVERPRRVRAAGAAGYLFIAALGAVALTRTEGTYLGLILVWAAPVLAGQWGYAGHRVAARPRAVLLGIGVPTVYLWLADAYAIGNGIWEISPTHTLGLRFGPLPLEEAVFFLITNVLVVQGLVLFLDPPGTASRRSVPPPPSARQADERSR